MFILQSGKSVFRKMSINCHLQDKNDLWMTTIASFAVNRKNCLCWMSLSHSVGSGIGI